MRALVARVDRLQRLALFEAAGRLGSFTAAGRELGIAQPAVTRQIRALERSVGVELFHRTANRSELSEAGRNLLATLDLAFSAVERTLDDLIASDEIFVLASPPGFAQELLVPHLDALQAVLGDRDLRLWLYDREAELANGHFDAALRIGQGRWPGLDSARLFDEQVVPIASTDFADEWALDSASVASDVLAVPLLHMEADRPWMSWTNWLANFDLALTPGRSRVIFNNYPTVLQQALAGRGVALGWAGLVEHHVADGVLTVVGPTVNSDRSYYVTWPAGSSEVIDGLVAWLLDDSSLSIAVRTTEQ